MIDLKSCPFCNGTGRLTRNKVMVRGVSRRAAWVYCLDCNIKTGYFFRDEDEHYCLHAAEAWNRRPLQKPLTLEELQPDTYAWIEFKDNREEFHPVRFGYNDLFGNAKLYFKLCSAGRHFIDDCGYNVYWRAWASKPTDEECAAAEWEV